jgi:hypothetical protein
MTNFIRTDQTRDRCPESITLKEAACTMSSDCQKSIYVPNKSGLWTGHCLQRPEIHVFNGTMNITKRTLGLCEMDGR